MTLHRTAGDLDVQVHATFERACGDGWVSPRYEAGYVIDEVLDLYGEPVETTDEEDEQILEYLERE